MRRPLCQTLAPPMRKLFSLHTNTTEPWPHFLGLASRSAIIWALALLVMFHIPLLGIPLVFATFPVLMLMPGLTQTGAHIEYIFAYVMLKSPYAWLSVGCYYYIAILLWQVLPRLRARFGM